MAKFEIFATQPSYFLFRRFHYLSGLPHEARSNQHARLRSQARNIGLAPWLAGNTAVPFYYGFDEQLSRTIDFLKSGNYLNVDLFALRLGSAGSAIAPLGSTPFTLKQGEMVEAYVVVQNKNIGHSLIPEVRDLYEAWTQFTVKDASGAVIYESGFLKPDGMLDV